MELWPQQNGIAGEVVGREEEERAEQFFDEVKQQKRVGWVRKEQAELLSATLRQHRRWFDDGSSPEMSKATGKQRRRKRQGRRRLRLNRMAKKLKEATTTPFPSPAQRLDGHARDRKQAKGSPAM